MAGTGSVVAEPNDPRNVIVKKLALVVDGRPDAEIDLTQDLKEIKKKVKKNGMLSDTNTAEQKNMKAFFPRLS